MCSRRTSHRRSPTIPAELRGLVPGFEATPVDYGDVCVNYDIGWFDEHQLDPPADFDDLLDPDYADLLVVENPATSSPGLAFLLATIATYGDGWRDYWTSLTANGVEVVDGWTEAYNERFSWTGGGPRPLVVSYASSPPAEVIFADPPRTDAPTAVVSSTCFRQIEFAGVLDGTDSPDEARELVDFLASERFQRELPLTLFVYPADASVELPPEFVEFTTVAGRAADTRSRRHRGEPLDLDRRVDRDRPQLTRPAAPAEPVAALVRRRPRRRAGRVPRRVLRGAVRDAARPRRRRSTRWATCWVAVARGTWRGSPRGRRPPARR